MAKDYSKEKIRVLGALSQGCTMTQAAKEAGIGRRTLYDLIDREAAFREEVEYAKESYKDDLLGEAERELRRRAFDPEDPEKKSHVLLIVLLKRLDPQYKENYKNETKIVHETVHEVSFSQDEMDAALKVLQNAGAKSE